jgi:hypothetical protein
MISSVEVINLKEEDITYIKLKYAADITGMTNL